MAAAGRPMTRRVTVRLSDRELAKLDAIASSAGGTRSEALRTCVESARPVIVATDDADAVRECNRLLAKAGGNLNQVARQLNAGLLSASDPTGLRRITEAVGRTISAVATTRSALVELLEQEGARIEEALADDSA